MKKHFILCFFACCYIMQNSIGQPILQANKFTQQDTAQVMLLIRQGYAARNTDIAFLKRVAKRALAMAQDLGFRKGVALAEHNLGVYHSQMGNQTKARQYFTHALHFFSHLQDSLEVTRAEAFIGNTYLKETNYVISLQHYNNGLMWIGEHKVSIEKADLLGVIGLIYSREGDAKKAIEYYQKALESYRYLKEKTMNLTQQIKLLREELKVVERLYRLHKQQSNYREALAFHERYLRLRDSVFNRGKVKQLRTPQIQYETSEKALEVQSQQVKLLQKTKVNEQLRNWLPWGVVLGFTIIGGLVIGLLRLRLRKNKQVISKQQALIMIEKELGDAYLAEERLAVEHLHKTVMLKNQQLSSKALHIIQKNELLYQVQESLTVISSKQKNRKSVFKVIQAINQSFNLDKDWKNFFNYFTEIHPEFFDKIKSLAPQLSYNDLRFCALIKLRFSSKEIASILGIVPGSVSVARHRIRKKLAIPTTQRLSDFIETL